MADDPMAPQIPAHRPARQPQRSTRGGVICVLLSVALLCATAWWAIHSFNGPGISYWRLQFFISIGLVVLAFAIFQVGRSLLAPSAEEVLAHDKRAPVVYLRPFDEDTRIGYRHPDGKRIGGKKIMNISWEASHETWLTRAFKDLGPFVAVGKPGETLAPVGAARFYLADDEWQQKVDELLRSAAVVVLRPETTAGTRWEAEEVFRLIDLRRVLLIVPNPTARPLAYARIRTLMEKTWALPAKPINTDAFMFDKEGRPQPMTLSGRASISLRAFIDRIRELQGITTKSKPPAGVDRHIAVWIGRIIALVGALLFGAGLITDSTPASFTGLGILFLGLIWMGLRAWSHSKAMAGLVALDIGARTYSVAPGTPLDNSPGIPFRIEGGQLSHARGAIPLDQLVWAYAECFYFYLIKRYQLVLWNRDAVATVLPVRAHHCRAALDRLRHAAPWLPVGYSFAMKETWNADRTELLALIDDCRASDKRLESSWGLSDVVRVQAERD